MRPEEAMSCKRTKIPPSDEIEQVSPTAKENRRREYKWTKIIYHIHDGRVHTTLYSSRNTGEKKSTGKFKRYRNDTEAIVHMTFSRKIEPIHKLVRMI